MERAFRIGCRLYYFDSLRVPHEALVTNWFHGGPDGQLVSELEGSQINAGMVEQVYTTVSKTVAPCGREGS